MDRILRDVASSAFLSHYNATGDLANDVPTSVAVKDSDAVAIAGSPFSGGSIVTDAGTGAYHVVLPRLHILDTYSVTWTLTSGDTITTQFEVVGSYLFEIPDLRLMDTQLANTTNYPTALLTAVREAVEERFEHVAGVAFRLRGTRSKLDGTGMSHIRLPRYKVQTVVSGSITGVALTANDIADLAVYPSGKLVRSSGAFWSWGSRNVEIVYEHGYQQTPEPVRRAALTYARYVALTKVADITSRATAVGTDIGFYKITIAGRDGPTGLPDVDAVLDAYGREDVLVA